MRNAGFVALFLAILIPSAVNVATLTGFALVAARASGLIDWSWWWVTAPLWAGWGLTIAILLAAAAATVFEIGEKR